MEDILRQLYHGELYPNEAIVDKSDVARDLSQKITQEQEYFKSILSVEDAVRFDEWLKELYKFDSNYEYKNFEYGFRLGALLMCEIMWSDDRHEA